MTQPGREARRGGKRCLGELFIDQLALAVPWIAVAALAAVAWAVTFMLARNMGNGPGTVGLALLPFLSGYLLTWAAVGVVAFATLAGTGRLLTASATAAKWLGVAIFIAAGIYQLTPFKDWCLRRCRLPIGALMYYLGFKGRRADGVTRITSVWLSHIAGPSGQWVATRKNGKEITMDPRINYYGNAVAEKFAKYINSAAAVVSGSALPAATQELVKIRASQVNGCAYCTDMHTKDAEHAGESPVRLNLVAAWREATVFTEAERAALELAEQGTRIADAAGGVTDEAWANAAKHYDDDPLGALVSLIALINTYNRVNVIIQQPAGDYQAGQWG